MKLKNSTKLLVFISLLSVILLSIPSISVRGQTTVRTEVFDIVKADFTWNKASYTNFTGPPIYGTPTGNPTRILIDESDPNYNWSKTAADNPWCTGSGTWGDPYVIEGLYINAQGVGGCILIHESSKSFIIRNCWFDTSGTGEFANGVHLLKSGNGTIVHNIMTYHHSCVYNDLNSNNNTISKNIMVGDHHTNGLSSRGVAITGGTCTDVLVKDNFIFNFTSGLVLNGIFNNTIRDNFIEDNIYITGFNTSPIAMASCDNSSIISNILAGAFAQAVFTIDEDNCEGNIIVGNGATTTLPSDISGLQVQQTDTPHISLQDSDYNYIGHNLLYQPAGGIPSYDPFLMIGIIALVSVVSIFAINKRKK
jgi:hypothetical protein